MEANRVVMILYMNMDEPTVGSGLRIGGNKILTSDLVATGTQHKVLLASKEVSATILTKSNDPMVDLAILEISGVEELPWLDCARVDRETVATVGCRAVGFPSFGRLADKRHSAIQVEGFIPTVDGVSARYLTLKITGPGIKDWPPTAGSVQGGSPWAGMSGAVVVSEMDQILGVISRHNPTEGNGALQLTPIDSIDSLPTRVRSMFWAALGVTDPLDLPLLPKSRDSKRLVGITSSNTTSVTTPPTWELRLLASWTPASEIRCFELISLNNLLVLATGDSDGTVLLHDVLLAGPGDLLSVRGNPLLGHTGPILSLAGGQLGDTPVVASGGADGTVRIWDLATGTLRTTFTGHSAAVNALAMGQVGGAPPDAISGGADGTVRIWNLATGNLRAILTGHTDAINALAVGQVDGTPVVISGGADRTVRIWDLATGTLRTTWTGHSEAVNALAMGQADGTPVVISGGADGTVGIWDLVTGRTLNPVASPPQEGPLTVQAVGQVGDTPVAAISSPDGTTRVWRIQDWKQLAESQGYKTSTSRAFDFVRFTPHSENESLLVWVDSEGHIRVGVLGEQTLSDQVEWVTDAPAQADLLRRRPLAKALATRLKRMNSTEPETSFLVQIDGPWGTGKSTLVSYLREELADDWLPVEFNAWRQAGIGPPWWALLVALRTSFVRNIPFHKRLWLRISESWARLKRLGGPFIVAASIMIGLAVSLFWMFMPSDFKMAGSGEVAKTITAVLAAVGTLWTISLLAGRFLFWDSARGARNFEQTSKNPMQEVAEHIAWLIDRIQRPVVFFIDDLDRCGHSYVVDLMEAIQTLIRDPGTEQTKILRRSSRRPAPAVYFVVAADGAWIRRSYETVYEKFSTAIADPGRPLGYLFLDKLFQLRVMVPNFDAPRGDQYLRHLLRPTGVAESKDQVSAEVKAVRARLATSTSESEIMDAYRSASPEARDRVSEETVERLTAPEIERETEHNLQRFAPLLQSNPRSTKRFLNNYAMHRSVSVLEGNPLASETLALWIILETRWPSLADYLRESPETIALADGDNGPDSKLPPEIKLLLAEPAVRQLISFEYGGPLTPDLVRSCCGG